MGATIATVATVKNDTVKNTVAIVATVAERK